MPQRKKNQARKEEGENETGSKIKVLNRHVTFCSNIPYALFDYDDYLSKYSIRAKKILKSASKGSIQWSEISWSVRIIFVNSFSCTHQHRVKLMKLYRLIHEGLEQKTFATAKENSRQRTQQRKKKTEGEQDG